MHDEATEEILVPEVCADMRDMLWKSSKEVHSHLTPVFLITNDDPFKKIKNETQGRQRNKQKNTLNSHCQVAALGPLTTLTTFGTFGSTVNASIETIETDMAAMVPRCSYNC